MGCAYYHCEATVMVPDEYGQYGQQLSTGKKGSACGPRGSCTSPWQLNQGLTLGVGATPIRTQPG